MSWASLLKIGTVIFGKAVEAVKATGKVAGNLAAKSPSIVNGAGSILHTASKPILYATQHPVRAVVAPGVAYAGWKALVDKKPVIDSAMDYGKKVMDVAIGEEKSNEITNDLSKAGDTITDIKETATEGKSLLSSLNESLGGIKDFIHNITHGEGMNMFGNFFGNLFHGNVSGMSVIGLLVAGLLSFGRFGWMGKIAGALLGMTMIGNNDSISHSEQVSKPLAQNVETESRGIHR